MSAHQTGITGLPSLFDVGSAFSMFVADFIQMMLGKAQSSFASALGEDVNGAYDAKTRSYEGSGGLRYRVPLHHLPSERHCKQRVPNIKILLDNCRRMCMEDDLPSTAEEKKFWATYRFVKYQSILVPLACILPPTYVMFKMFQHKIPEVIRGRTIPITLSIALAEQIGEQIFPAHQLLSSALKAKTPLGDAARAEWQRLQPVNIPFHVYTAYQVRNFFGNPPRELLFGGDVIELVNS